MFRDHLTLLSVITATSLGVLTGGSTLFHTHVEREVVPYSKITSEKPNEFLSAHQDLLHGDPVFHLAGIDLVEFQRSLEKETFPNRLRIQRLFTHY